MTSLHNTRLNRDNPQSTSHYINNESIYVRCPNKNNESHMACNALCWHTTQRVASASLAAWQVLIAHTDSGRHTSIFLCHMYTRNLNRIQTYTPAVLWTSKFTEHDSKFACAHVPSPRLLQDMLLKQSHTITAVRLHRTANAKSNIHIWCTKSLTR